eukprot:2945848-Prymnesium_polylepis.2
MHHRVRCRECVVERAHKVMRPRGRGAEREHVQRLRVEQLARRRRGRAKVAVVVHGRSREPLRLDGGESVAHHEHVDFKRGRVLQSTFGPLLAHPSSRVSSRHSRSTDHPRTVRFL